MTPLVPLIMWGCIPAVLYIFSRLPPQRAMVMSMVGAWLFLPLAIFKVPGIPPYTKMAATGYGVLLATMVFDAVRLTTFKPGLLDLPMLIWCLCPFASSITNDLGPYDGFSASFAQVVTWGLPYFLGRIYLNNLEGMRQLAIGIFAGGLIYIPFCLVENAKGPLLHLIIYGFNAFEDWGQAKRYGGWRPVVFMQHGLMVGVWMMSAALIGLWFWKTGTLKKLWNIPVKRLAIAVTISFILCLSTGAYILLLLGLLILFTGKWLRTSLPLIILISGISFYLYVGVSGTFSSKDIIAGMSVVFSPDRVASLKFRFDNEEILGDKARQRMLFGWGGFGRNRVFDQNGKDISITDSLWIIAFGINGVVGLSSLTASFFLPVLSFALIRYPARSWSNPKVAPAAILAVLLILYMLDCVLNAMVNPIFALTCGGLSGLVQKDTEPYDRKAVRPSAQARSLAQSKSKAAPTRGRSL
ncbi:MAG: O-antigen ligase domain-containing protein [Potamolinea sp.]